MNWSKKFEVFFRYLHSDEWRVDILNGIWITIKIAVLGLIIGIILGMLIAVVKVTPKYRRTVKILDKICDFYIAFFRGTPMVVQLLIAYYVLLPAIGVKGASADNTGIIVFGLNSAAYVAEIMRGGINSVDKGQMEAARALGLSYPMAMIKVVIPQAIKNILPTLGNEFITLIKETSVLSFITVVDLYKVMDNIAANSYDRMIPYLFMAVIYIALVLLITLLIRILERALSKSDRSNERKTKKRKEGAK